MAWTFGVWLLAAVVPAHAAPRVVVLGSGAEAPGGWSDAPLRAFAAGQRVAVLAVDPPTDPGATAGYLVDEGALAATEFTIPDAGAAATTDLSGFDAFYLRGDDPAAMRAAWAGTAVETAILGAQAVGAAGAAGRLLGGEDFVAGRAADPLAALTDCTDAGSAHDAGFLPLLAGVVVDTGFTQQGGLARMLPMTGGSGLTGVGIDEMTAAVFTDGLWQVYGTATVTIVRGGGTPCAGGAPRVDEVAVDVLTEGWAFDPVGDTVMPGGTPRDLPYHRPDADLALVDGNEGTVSLQHIDALSLYCGTLELWPGSGRFDGVVVPDALDAATVDARLGGGVWALAAGPAPVSVLLPAGDQATALAGGGWTIDDGVADDGAGGTSAIVLLAEGGSAGEERGWADPTCENPRLARAITGIRAAVVPPDGTVAFGGVGLDPGDTGGGDDTGNGGDTGNDTGTTKDAGGCGCAAGAASGPGPLFVGGLVLLATRFLRRGGNPVTGGP